MKRREWFHLPRGRIRIVSLVCLVMGVVDATHLVWLVVAPIVGFCGHLRGRCGVFSVQGCCCSQGVFEGLFCGSDARVRHGRDWFVSC